MIPVAGSAKLVAAWLQSAVRASGLQVAGDPQSQGFSATNFVSTSDYRVPPARVKVHDVMPRDSLQMDSLGSCQLTSAASTVATCAFHVRPAIRAQAQLDRGRRRTQRERSLVDPLCQPSVRQIELLIH
jgi:hypothetical protein